MDFNDTAGEAAFRADARAWLAANAPAHELPRGNFSDAEEVLLGRAWQRCLSEGGYAGIAIDQTFGGRGGTVIEAVIFAEEEARYRLAKGPYVGIGQGMAMAALIRHGSPAQIEQFVGPTLRGEVTWCQLFSEPGAGSDLAAVRTRAERGGNGWLVNGQKVWSSWAHEADWGLLLARTDPCLPKHRGLSFFLLDMKGVGIDVRPIRQISGKSDFNEIFFTDVAMADDCLLGALGEGWTCAMTVLGSERLNSRSEEPTCSPVALLEYARATRRDGGSALDSAAVRRVIAEAIAREHAEGLYQARLRTFVSRGDEVGALPAIIKLSFATQLQRMAGFALELRELAGVAFDDEDEETSLFMRDYLWGIVMRIAGGADEVLRNQLAERVLGMPGEIRADKDLPFNQL